MRRWPFLHSNRSARSPAPRLVALVLAFAVAAPGCVNNRVVTPFSAQDVRPTLVRPHDGPLPFDYETAPIVYDNHDLKTKGPYEIKAISFPSAGDNGQDGNMITARYYRGRGEGKKSLVIVLPIWGSKFEYPSEKLARVVRSRAEGDTNVLLVQGESRLVDMDEIATAQDVESFRRLAAKMANRCRVSVIDVRRMIDWAESQPDVDPDRIALAGLSVGAIIGSLAALVEPRISATVLVMGSARPSEVLARATGRTAAGRDVIVERFGWTIERYESEIRDAFDFLDASNWAGGVVDPENVLMFDAMHDERMPKTARDALWVAMGRPERITLKYGHGYSFLSMSPLGMNYTTDRIWEFLEPRL